MFDDITLGGGAGNRDAEFQSFLSQMYAGDEVAWTMFWNQLSEPLISIANQKLSRRLQRKLSPEDAAMSACRTFLRRLKSGQYHRDKQRTEFRIASPQKLCGLLARITICKCAGFANCFRTRHRDLEREVPLFESPGTAGAGREMESQGLTPEQRLILEETVQDIFDHFKNPVHQQIIRLHLEGEPVRTISAEVGRAEYTVREVLRRLTDWLDDYGKDPDGAAAAPSLCY